MECIPATVWLHSGFCLTAQRQVSKVWLLSDCREPLLFVIALCEGYRVNVGWANPTSENFNTLRVSPSAWCYYVCLHGLGCATAAQQLIYPAVLP
jgi:hypothetical protein